MVSLGETKELAGLADTAGSPPPNAATSGMKRSPEGDEAQAVIVSGKPERKKMKKSKRGTLADNDEPTPSPKKSNEQDSDEETHVSDTAYFSAPAIAMSDRGSAPVHTMLEMLTGSYAANFKFSSAELFKTEKMIDDEAADVLLDAAAQAILEKICSKKFVKKYLLDGCGDNKLTLMEPTKSALKNNFKANQQVMLERAELWLKKGKPSSSQLRTIMKEHNDALLKTQAATAKKGCEAITNLLAQAQNDIARDCKSTPSVAAATKAATNVISDIQSGLNDLIAGISKDEAGSWKLPVPYNKLKFSKYHFLDEDEPIIPSMAPDKYKEVYEDLAPEIDSKSLVEAQDKLKQLHNKMIAGNVQPYNLYEPKDFPNKTSNFKAKFGLSKKDFIRMKLLEDRLDVGNSPGEQWRSKEFSSPSSQDAPQPIQSCSPHCKALEQIAELEVECVEDLNEKLDEAAEGCHDDMPEKSDDSDEENDPGGSAKDKDAADSKQKPAADKVTDLNAADPDPQGNSEGQESAADSPMTVLMKSDYKTWDKPPRWQDASFKHILFTPGNEDYVVETFLKDFEDAMETCAKWEYYTQLLTRLKDETIRKTCIEAVRREVAIPSSSGGVHVHRQAKWDSYAAAKAFLMKHYADDETRARRLMKKFENTKMKAGDDMRVNYTAFYLSLQELFSQIQSCDGELVTENAYNRAFINKLVPRLRQKLEEDEEYDDQKSNHDWVHSKCEKWCKIWTKAAKLNKDSTAAVLQSEGLDLASDELVAALAEKIKKRQNDNDDDGDSSDKKKRKRKQSKGTSTYVKNTDIQEKAFEKNYTKEQWAARKKDRQQNNPYTKNPHLYSKDLLKGKKCCVKCRMVGHTADECKRGASHLASLLASAKKAQANGDSIEKLDAFVKELEEMEKKKGK